MLLKRRLLQLLGALHHEGPRARGEGQQRGVLQLAREGRLEARQQHARVGEEDHLKEKLLCI